MVSGTPDWGFTKVAVGHVLSEDLAELAARLGTLHVRDRRGYVLWQCDFNKGIDGISTTLSGLNAAIELDSTNPHWPPYALKLIGGSNLDRSCKIEKFLGPVEEGGCGFELSVDFASDFYDCVIKLELDNDNLYYAPAIKFSSDTDKIYYLAGTGSWVELDDLPLLKHTFSGYRNIKLAVDFDTGYYIRFILDDITYDLSDKAIYTTPTFGNHHLLAYFYFRSRDGENDICYVDGLILTQNE